jgi:outer membrane lipoprotein-sorting protein
MKRLNIGFFVFFGAFLAVIGLSGNTFAQSDAREVVRRMDTREDGDTLTSDTLMVLVNQRNQQRVRNIRNIRKDYGSDSKGIVFFLSPADVRNTAYMSFDWDDPEKEDDSWLYLPALQKVKRIASSDKSSSFMGSDFTYSDINGLEIEDWEYSFVKEDADMDGHRVWVIQGLPKEGRKDKVMEETGYLKTMMWIRKDNYMAVKGKYWVRQGRKIKYFRAEEIEKVDDIWTAHKLTMVTTAKGKVEHTSVLQFSNIQYNLDIDDSAFTTRRMERGL